jgi:hypothetical protein
MMSLVKRHPLITFFVLAFAFAWSMWLLIALYPDSAAYMPSATFGPLFTRVRGKSVLGRSTPPELDQESQ